jgi:predicted SprT family Zn-dependent metalloprotease
VGYADRYKIYFAPGVYRVDTIEGLALIAHEVAHCLQYQRHGAWRFRARYLAAYFKNRLRGMSHLKAYRSIPFEIEAREAEEQVYRALRTLQSGLLEIL